MAKKAKTVARKQQKPQPELVNAVATARRFDGNAVKLEIVFQPQAAAVLTDQIVHALVRNGRRR